MSLPLLITEQNILEPSMKKYYLVARNTWDQTIAYRLNFVMWRFRVFLSLITTYFLWLTLLPQGKVIGSYTQPTILTYILGGSIVSSIVLSTRVADVAEEITQGDLSNYLTRPVNYIGYYFAKDIGDKGMNILFSLFEITIFFLIVHPPFSFPPHYVNTIEFIIAMLVAIFINFSINMMLSFIGFFSSETWAPRFIYYILLSFFAGSLFPLDIFPHWLYILLTVLPFSYLIYTPMKLYLGQLSLSSAMLALSIALAWAIILYFCVQILWKKGLKQYSAEGK